MKTDLELYNKTIEIINGSKKIVLVGHRNPDPDALCSVIGLSKIIAKLKKSGVINNEVQIVPFFSIYYKESIDLWGVVENVVTGNLSEYLDKESVDTLIMLDGNPLHRFVSDESQVEELERVLKVKGIKTICIDHHLKDAYYFKSDLEVIRCLPSCTQEVYSLFHPSIDVWLDAEIGKLLLAGLLSDTGQFMYKNPHIRDSFEMTADIVELGVEIEGIVEALDRSISPMVLNVISNLISNLNQDEKCNFNYSFITPQLFNGINLSEKEINSYINTAAAIFVNEYIRKIEPNKWGFVIRPVFQNGRVEKYRGSFRVSSSYPIDTTKFGEKLNGGGHAFASGFTINTDNIEEAITQTLEVIYEDYEQAKVSVL